MFFLFFSQHHEAPKKRRGVRPRCGLEPKQPAGRLPWCGHLRLAPVLARSPLRPFPQGSQPRHTVPKLPCQLRWKIPQIQSPGQLPRDRSLQHQRTPPKARLAWCDHRWLAPVLPRSPYLLGRPLRPQPQATQPRHALPNVVKDRWSAREPQVPP